MVVQEVLHILILAILPSRVLASGNNTAESRHIRFLPLAYQSGGLTFNDWVALFTLCFAPLIAHILSGVPKIVFLSQDRPSWRHQLGLYNPTTILWRYFAITDRRLRAKRWNAANMSASNAYFWTPRGWDGSEALSRKSREYCVSVPDSAHATLLSASTIKTLVISLQGADALYTIIINTYDPDAPTSFGNTLSVGSLFFPLAFLGLMRLTAAYWLTEDFVYVNIEDLQKVVTAEGFKSDASTEKIQLMPVRTPSTSEILVISDIWTGEGYRSPNSWQSCLFRALFLVPFIGLGFICIYSFVPTQKFPTVVVGITVLTLVIFYLLFLAITIIVFGFYFIHQRHRTTVLPCIASLWYQVYTGLLIILILVIIVIASIETRKSPCGYYTTWPLEIDPCSYLPSATKTTEGIFRVAVSGNITDLIEQPMGAMSILYLDGWCSGDFHGHQGFQFVNTTW